MGIKQHVVELDVEQVNSLICTDRTDQTEVLQQANLLSCTAAARKNDVRIIDIEDHVLQGYVTTVEDYLL